MAVFYGADDGSDDTVISTEEFNNRFKITGYADGPSILVYVSGGMVQNVFSTRWQSVVVFDDDSEDYTEEVDARFEQLLSSGNYAQIY